MQQEDFSLSFKQGIPSSVRHKEQIWGTERSDEKQSGQGLGGYLSLSYKKEKDIVAGGQL
jgi:hypothetical protein